MIHSERLLLAAAWIAKCVCPNGHAVEGIGACAGQCGWAAYCVADTCSRLDGYARCQGRSAVKEYLVDFHLQGVCSCWLSPNDG